MEAANVTVIVDADVCSATGNCVAIAPEIFELEPGEDVARVVVDLAESPHLLALATEAAECCPLSAIDLKPALG